MSKRFPAIEGGDVEIPSGQEVDGIADSFILPADYQNAKNDVPALSVPEEQALIARAKLGDVEAREILITANLRAIIYIAQQYQVMSRKSAKFALVDLVNQGALGFLDAINRFDQDRKCRLITYAAYYIRAFIRTYVFDNNSELKVSIKNQARYRKMRRLGVKLRESLGRQPSDSEVEAAYTALVLAEKIKRLKKQIASELESALRSTPDEAAVDEEFERRVLLQPSLITPRVFVVGLRDLRVLLQGALRVDAEVDGAFPYKDLLVAQRECNPLAVLIEEQCGVASLVARYLESSSPVLTPREKSVLAMRFGISLYGLNDEGIEYTFEDIGERLGFTRQRAQQVVQGALAKIKCDLVSHGVTKVSDVLDVEECV